MKKYIRGCLLVWAMTAICIFIAGAASAAVGKTDHTVYDYTSAEGWPEAPEITAGSAYMIELNSGAVLYSKEGEAKSYPASTTKILTALLTLENCSLDEEVTFSHNAIYDIEEGGHHYEFQEGEVLTVSECLQFLLVESVNEVAYALAEHISGSVDAFAELMNERAAELGATGTHFVNPHGLNDENHYTTARDMAMILWGCVQSEAFRQYASRPSVSLAGRAIQTEGFSTYTNHHLMLLSSSSYYNSSVVCGKTGYTSLAGNTLVTYASQGGMDVICILMQGGSDRFVDTQKLLDYAFDSFTLISQNDVNTRNTSLVGSLALNVNVQGGGSLLLPKDADWSDVTSEFAVRSSEEGESLLGEKTWYYQGLTMGSAAVSMGLSSEAAVEDTDPAEEETAGSAETTAAKESAAAWTIQEVAALVLLGFLIVVLFIILIRLILSRFRVRRRRRGRSRRRRRR